MTIRAQNRGLFSLAIICLILVSLAGLSACGKPAPAPSPAPTPTSTVTEVRISGFAFVPETVTVSVGNKVTWTNQDAAPHTVTSETGLFDSGTLARNASFSYSFSQRGTFSYYCTIHPSMRAKVIVN